MIAAFMDGMSNKRRGMTKKLKILFVSPEVVPFAKTGGLADVAGTLPGALAALGHDVRTILPFYQVVKKGGYVCKELVSPLPAPLPWDAGTAKIFALQKPNNVPIYFLENDHYFDREYLYGSPQGDYPDNAERFIFFCRVVLEFLKTIDFRPDVIHCHDWQTALIPVYLKTIFRGDPFFGHTLSFYTIHNLAYQGIFLPETFSLTGLPPELFSLQGLEYWDKINLMKGGIIFSDIISTVSSKYSQEIRTPEYGYGLEGVLQDRSEDLYGIINGVDYDEWHPARDRFIIANYDRKKTSRKEKCRKDLIALSGMKINKKMPLLAMISRLADQKGFDLLAQAMDQIMDLELGFVLLGTGEEKYHDLFQEIGKRFPDRASIRLEFNNALAHKIEAGADFFLMPSRYEPCGLNQIYSMKYGTIPIVRATGGLDDTVEDFDPVTGCGTGFKFTEYAVEPMVNKIREAISIYKDKKLWRKIMDNAMAQDFSWENSAKRYQELYLEGLERLS
jgi:starch synthase